MSLQLNVEVHEVQMIMAGLAKLPLEASLDAWSKVKAQAEDQLAAQQRAQEAEPQPGLNDPQA